MQFGIKVSYQKRFSVLIYRQVGCRNAAIRTRARHDQMGVEDKRQERAPLLSSSTSFALPPLPLSGQSRRLIQCHLCPTEAEPTHRQTVRNTRATSEGVRDRNVARGARSVNIGAPEGPAK